MPLDQFLEAARDVIGLLRAMYRAEREPYKRRTFAAAAREIKAAAAAAEQHAPGSPEYHEAMFKADMALNSVSNALHFTASLAPVVGAAASRFRKAR